MSRHKIFQFSPLSLKCRLTSFLLPILISSCATILPVPFEKTEYYVIPEITYLRQSPGYEEKALNQINRGDRVIVLQNGESSWWQVQQVSTGQIGWLQKALLSSVPVSSNFYYVNQDNLPLLACPKSDCPVLALISRGDRVTKLDEQASGWWLVQTAVTGVQGWLPEASLTEILSDHKIEPPPRDYYYVAVKNLGLRSKPWINDAVIKTLEFNQQVQKISQNSQGWFKVRLPADDSQGWVLSRYLEQLPTIAPRPLPAKIKPKLWKPKKEAPAEPEVM
jgi:uncharacterized protein YgiM (DUF1202 family)